MNIIHKKNSIKNMVLDKIKKGKAKMKPRWHFVLKGVLVALGVALLLFTLLYLFSFILFVLAKSGVVFIPSFGPRGVGLFLMSLPWILIILSIVALAVLGILVKKYSFAYKKPTMYSLLGILLIVFLGGFFVNKTKVHDEAMRFAQDRKLPVAGPLYRKYNEMADRDSICVGKILELSSDRLLVLDADDNEIEIKIDPKTRIPRSDNSLSFGEDVLVMFEEREEGGELFAIGIKHLKEKPRFVKDGVSHSMQEGVRIDVLK